MAAQPDAQVEIEFTVLRDWANIIAQPEYARTVAAEAAAKMAHATSIVLDPPPNMPPNEVERYRGEARAWGRVLNWATVYPDVYRESLERRAAEATKTEDHVGPEAEAQWYEHQT